MKGFGDPTLVTEDIWRFVYDLSLAGVKRVAGDVIYDDTFFDSRRLIEGGVKRSISRMVRRTLPPGCAQCELQHGLCRRGPGSDRG